MSETASHRTLVLDEPSAADSSNDPRFSEAAGQARPVAAGWDPYEVWRNRVLAPQTPGVRKR
jgi:hypothetical protein